MKKAIIKSATLLGALTFLSRILGLIRDSVIARIFGVGIMADAFMMAFTLPNMLRRLLAEGALSIAFVPIFSGDLALQDKSRVQESLNVLFTVITVFLAVFVVVAVFFAPGLISLFAPGFVAERRDIAILLTRVMFPFILFLSSASVMVGLLHALGHFGVPALSPIVLNLAIIFCAFTLTPFMHPPVLSLAIGVLIGGVLLWLFQYYKIKMSGYKIRWNFQLQHPAVKRFRYLMMPALLGVGVYQINVLISRILASLLPEGSVTYLYYSDRFLELPLGVFAVSVATVVLPALSKNAHQKDYSYLKETFLFALRLVFFVCLPAMIGLMMLRIPILAMVFQYGQFHIEDTLKLSHIFLMASFGLWAVGGVRVALQAFYSLGQINETVKVAGVALVINVVFGLILMIPMKAAGLTLANAISATIHFSVLIYLLGRRLEINIMEDIFKPILPMLFSAIMMGLCLFPIGHLGIWQGETTFVLRFAVVIGAVFLGVGLYILFSYVLGVNELKVMIRRIRGQKTEGKTAF